MRARLGTVTLLLGIALACFPSGTRAQAEPADTSDVRVEEARRLRTAGRLADAVRQLRAYLRDHPDDGAALRLLATTLEAAGQVGAAREAFEAALRHYPDDPLLRLDYGELLVEIDEVDEARKLLVPMVQDPAIPPEQRADAHVLLGRLALMSGARDAAEAAFHRALSVRPGHGEALRRLRALQQEQAPWTTARIENGGDDQPVRAFDTSVSGGYPLLPWLELDGEVGVRAYDGESDDETVPEALAGATALWDLVNVEARAWIGGFRRSSQDAIDWKGGGSLAFLGPGGLRMRMEGGRGPYLFTEASLDTALVPVRFAGRVGRPDARGWAGNMAYEQLRFDDDNRVEELRAWILGPIFRSPGLIARLGYEFRGADAREITFSPEPDGEIPSQGAVPGRYAPIYTPEQLQAHFLRADLRIERPESFDGILEAGWGFYAEEEAPQLFASVPEVPGAGVALQFQRRSFEPWHVVGRVTAPLAPEFELRASVGHRRTAFTSRTFLVITGTFFHMPTELR